MSATRLALMLLLLARAGADAQGTAAVVARADSLVGFGALARAESLYYAAVNARPRDPVARAALGRYLGSRGAHRIALVLLDEARRFGADPRAIARDLLPIQRAAGEFGAIAASSAPVLGADERARARWLVDHPPSLTMPDSTVAVLRAATRPGSLGIIRIAINGQPIDASIDLGAVGLTVDARTIGRSLRRFGIHGVVDSMSLGAVQMRNVAARIDTSAAGVTIGLDQLLRFAPSIGQGGIVLRRSGRLPAGVAGSAIPFRFFGDGPEPRFLVGGVWRAFDAPALEAMRAQSVHIDGRRGRLVVAR